MHARDHSQFRPAGHRCGPLRRGGLAPVARAATHCVGGAAGPRRAREHRTREERDGRQRIRTAAAPDHHQPGTRRPAEAGAGVRPADCGGAAPGGTGRGGWAWKQRRRRRSRTGRGRVDAGGRAGARWIIAQRARGGGDGAPGATVGAGRHRGAGRQRARGGGGGRDGRARRGGAARSGGILPRRVRPAEGGAGGRARGDCGDGTGGRLPRDPRTGACEACADDRRGGRAQRAPHRPGRVRQDHDGACGARDHATAGAG